MKVENKNQMLFAHVTVILPDERILMRKLCTSISNNSKWSATLERGLSEEENPREAIIRAIDNDLDLRIATDLNGIARATIRSFGSITIKEFNRKIFPFIVEIKQITALKSNVQYKFSAINFATLADDIINNTIYIPTPYTAKHTLNTIHVIKEMHLRRVLIY